MFQSQHKQWQRRKLNYGDRAVGRIDENAAEQTVMIKRHLWKTLDKGSFYPHGLDFGCGWGRFSDTIASVCSHVWLVDLFDDWVNRAAMQAPTTTPVVLRSQRLPIDDASMDLVADIMTLQSIGNDVLAREAMHDLKRVARPGATVISLHTIKPRQPTRTAAQRAAHLGLSKWHETVLTDIDEAKEPYSYLVGVRA